jgi:DNA replication initiation complex subunit (GINS family)
VKRLSAEWEGYITAGLTEEERSFFLSILERMMAKAAEKVNEDINKEEKEDDEWEKY